MKRLTRNDTLVLTALVLLAGIIGPWANLFGELNIRPIEDVFTGIMIFGAVGLVILSALTSRFMRPVSILVGLGLLAYSLHTLMQLSDMNGTELGQVVTPGWGLWVTIVGSVILIASTWIARKQIPMEKYNIAKVTVGRMDKAS